MRNRTIVRRGALSALAAFALVLVLVGCGGGEKGELAAGGWDAIVAAAKEEGRVVFYNGSTTQQGDRLIKAFNAKYPEIEVRSERVSADGIARVDAQIASGSDGADLFMLGDPEWFSKNADAFLPLTGGPDVANLEADKWIVEDKAAVVSTAPYSMFVWNTDIFPAGFKTYEDFLAEPVRGRLAFRGDASKSAAGFLDFLDTSVSPDYLRRLGEMKPKLYPSVVPATEAIASGEVGATIAAQPAQVLDLIESGAPIAYAYPNPGYSLEYGVAALKSAHRPNAAVVFTEFMMSAEGQEALNGDQQGIASRPGIPGAVDPAGWQSLDPAAFPPEVIEEWNAKLDEYLG